MSSVDSIQTDLVGSSESSHTSPDLQIQTTFNALPSPDFGDATVSQFHASASTGDNPASSHTNPSPQSRSRSAASERSTSSAAEAGHKICKRQRNTEAARRYRQRKVDRVSELEEALLAMTKERDELKLKLAGSEAEADVLRGMVGK